MSIECLVTNVRPSGGNVVDLRIVDGAIAEIGPALSSNSAAATHIDGNGDLAIPALVEAHVHFDKTLWGLPWHGHQAGPLLTDRISFERQYLAQASLEPEPQARGAVRQAIANGSLHVRSHADVTPELGLSRVEALLSIAQEFAEDVDLQIVAFPQLGVVAAPGSTDLLDAAIACGAGVVGGIDPGAIDRDPIAHLDAIFGIADKRGAGVDIHLHETGTMGALSLELIVERTAALGMQGKVMISHGYCLGTVELDEAARLADLLARADVAVLTAVPGHVPFPPVKLLHDAGVVVCLGSDSIRDCWSPFGNADMLERAWMLAYRSNFRADADVELALAFATHGGARALGLANYGLEIGCAADLALLPFETLAEAVISRGVRRRVLRRGRLVAHGGDCLV